MSSENKTRTYHLFAFSERGKQLKKVLSNALNLPEMDENALERPLKRQIEAIFKAHGNSTPQVVVFIGAVGIAVRSIKDAIDSKFSDPPVIVVDDMGHHAIALLSGHFGNANALTIDLCERLNAAGYKTHPVITTATDLRGHEGFERVMKEYAIPPAPYKTALKKINMAIADDAPIHLYVSEHLKQQVKPMTYPKLTVHTSLDALRQEPGLKVVIDYRAHDSEDSAFYSLISKSLTLGTGLKKDLPYAQYHEAFLEFCAERQLAPDAFSEAASIDLKADEPALAKLAEHYEMKTTFYSADALMPYEGQYEGSEFVKTITGVRAVAGPSAYATTSDAWALHVTKKNGCTFAVGRNTL